MQLAVGEQVPGNPVGAGPGTETWQILGKEGTRRRSDLRYVQRFQYDVGAPPYPPESLLIGRVPAQQARPSGERGHDLLFHLRKRVDLEPALVCDEGQHRARRNQVSELEEGHG